MQQLEEKPMLQKLLKQSIEIDNRLIGQIFSIGSERQRMDFLPHVLSNLYMYLSLIRQHFLSHKEYVHSVFNLVLQRKALGAEALAIQRDAILSGKYPELRTKLQELRNIRMLLARRVIHIDQTQGHIEPELELLNEKKEKLEKELAQQIPEIRLERNIQTVNLKTISKALLKGTALIEFIKLYDFDFKKVDSRNEEGLKPPHYLAFILTSEGQENLKVIDLGNADIIDHMLTSFINSISKVSTWSGVIVLKFIKGSQSNTTINQTNKGSQCAFKLIKLLTSPL